MDEMELMMKELRVSAWEQTGTVLDKQFFVVGDLYDYVQDDHGKYMIVENRPLSI